MSIFLRFAASSTFRKTAHCVPCARHLHASRTRRYSSNDGGLNNILAGGEAPAVQVKTITPEGIQLADGLILPSACIFLDGKVFLWNVPAKPWDHWTSEHFEIFDTVVPKPEILLFGTGERVEMIPHTLRQYLNKVGVQVDVMNTRNACSTYNLLSEEGRRVAAALLPLSPRKWANASTL